MNLPKPKNAYERPMEPKISSGETQQSERTPARVPPYGQRKNWVPNDVQAYGDGGAFPEIHMEQYPLNMGRPGAHKSRAVVRVDAHANGKVKYDRIVKHGDSNNKIMHTALADLKEKTGDADLMALPDGDEEAATAERTRLALEAKMAGKVRGPGKPTTHPLQEQAIDKAPQYVRYNVNPNAPGFSAATQQRVIKMVEAPVDPMEPPKHKLGKAERVRPVEAPVPVMHAPAKKLTKEEQEAWKIPPCVSNWKNERGFIIPLDKRLAADGRGLQETTINDKFASFSEALYVSERKAAADLRNRNHVRKQMALQEKEEREAELRELAGQVRAARGNRDSSHTDRVVDYSDSDDDAPPRTEGIKAPRGVSNKPAWLVQQEREQKQGEGQAYTLNHSSSSSSGDVDEGAASDATPEVANEDLAGDLDSSDEGSDDGEEKRQKEDAAHARNHGHDAGETAAERTAREQRERLRTERRREREKELRDEARGGKSKGRMDVDRDISEKVALGLHTGKGGGSGSEAMYDSRLFNQSAGMDSGFGAEDEYNAYSKPLFERDGVANSIYRPRQAAEDAYGDAETQMKALQDTSKFRPDQTFRGSEAGEGAGPSAGPRTEPVQFEVGKDKIGGRRRDEVEDDPFGIADLVSQKKKKQRRD